MKIIEASECNSWLTFADDLIWPREASAPEAKLLRDMLCQQILFVETALIPDSWWLTNPQLRHQFDGTDLLDAINYGWIIPALERQSSDSGLHGRWLKQKTLPPERRYSRLVGEEGHGAFLSRIDKQASFVTYDVSILGAFFDAVVRMIIRSSASMSLFGLSRQWRRISDFARNKAAAGQPLTMNDFYNLFQDNKATQDKVMAMFQPVYLINAPLNYGYNITLAGNDTSRLFKLVKSLLASLVDIPASASWLAEKRIADLLVPLDVDDPVLENAGMLTFAEMEAARSVHFDTFKAAYLAYCGKEIGIHAFEDAFRSYASNLKDFLAQRNARFDIFLARRIRDAGEVARAVKPFLGPVAAYAANKHLGVSDPMQVILIGTGISVLADSCQRQLESMAIKREGDAVKKGALKLISRLDVWDGNQRAFEQL